ncbi:unnamed protein product (plasmid) [Sinorhizobium meliloti Rm41]|nr:unnamed protein product [Sinorhizobium meliloti Rm41]
MDYLIRWRMTLAADRLENSGDPFAAIAFSLGYEFSAASSGSWAARRGNTAGKKSPSTCARAEAMPGQQTAMVAN